MRTPPTMTPDGRQGVAQDVQVSPPDVEVLFARPLHGPGGYHVGDEADRGDEDHRPAVHCLGGGEPFVSFIEDVNGKKDQRGAVDQGRQDFHPVEAIGPGGRRNAGRQFQGKKAEDEGHDVGQHVPGVAHQGKGIRQVPADEFNDHDDPGDPRGNQQGFPVSLEIAVGVYLMGLMIVVAHFFPFRSEGIFTTSSRIDLLKFIIPGRKWRVYDFVRRGLARREPARSDLLRPPGAADLGAAALLPEGA